MNKDLPTHPTIFLFMAQLRCYVYQQGISNVALNHAGVNKPSKSSLAAQKLANRAREVEEKYLQGLITPTEVLQHAAVHFADNSVQDALIRDSNNIVAQTYNTTDGRDDEDNLTQSQDPALVDPELEDERRTALEADEDLTDMGSDDWVLAHWSGRVQGIKLVFFAVPCNKKQPLLTTLQRILKLLVTTYLTNILTHTFLYYNADVCPTEKPINDATPICSLCYDVPEYQWVLDQCSHALCIKCIHNIPVKACPFDQKPFNVTKVTRVNVAQMVIAHKKDAKNGFGIPAEAINNDPSANQRQADTSAEEDQQRQDLEAIHEAEEELRNAAAGDNALINILTSKLIFLGQILPLLETL